MEWSLWEDSGSACKEIPSLLWDFLVNYHSCKDLIAMVIGAIRIFSNRENRIFAYELTFKLQMAAFTDCPIVFKTELWGCRCLTEVWSFRCLWRDQAQHLENHNFMIKGNWNIDFCWIKTLTFTVSVSSSYIFVKRTRTSKSKYSFIELFKLFKT